MTDTVGGFLTSTGPSYSKPTEQLLLNFLPFKKVKYSSAVDTEQVFMWGTIVQTPREPHLHSCTVCRTYKYLHDSTVTWFQERKKYCSHETSTGTILNSIVFTSPPNYLLHQPARSLCLLPWSTAMRRKSEVSHEQTGTTAVSPRRRTRRMRREVSPTAAGEAAAVNCLCRRCLERIQKTEKQWIQ